MADSDNLSRTWMTAFSTAVLSPAGGAPELALGGAMRRTEAFPVGRTIASSSRSAAVIAEPESESVDHAHAVAARAVLNEELFRSVLSRERRRADRFDEVFALGTVTLSEGGGALPPELAAQIADALHAVTREADVVGWLEQDAVLGVIFADVDHPTNEMALQIQGRVRDELETRLDACLIAQLDIRWYVHAGPGAEGAEGLLETDPLLDDIRSVQERRTALDAAKRVFDIVCSAILLVLLSPVFLVVAALVKLTSPGPVLFRQVRVGQLAEPFTMLKFRSMYTKSDSAIHQQFVADFIKSGGKPPQNSGDKVFKIVNDPRITPLGRILRKTSLDELPQLWNVFRGDMSLVGPRPPLRYELEQYRAWHWRRVLEAKPGVTGLWQVEGRSRTTFDEMVRLDLRYVRNRSLWTDIKILLATPRAVVTGKGAC